MRGNQARRVAGMEGIVACQKGKRQDEGRDGWFDGVGRGELVPRPAKEEE